MHLHFHRLPPTALRWLAACAVLVLVSLLFAGSTWLEMEHPLSAVFMGRR